MTYYGCGDIVFSETSLKCVSVIFAKLFTIHSPLLPLARSASFPHNCMRVLRGPEHGAATRQNRFVIGVADRPEI